MKCKFCTKDTITLIDLGHTPLANSFLTIEQLREPEITYPLKVFVCPACWLVQVEYQAASIFGEDYIYYSSESPSNVSHAKEYAEMMVERFGKFQYVMEIGSNDGYLLQHFKQSFILGVEPAMGPAMKARDKGVATRTDFFSSSLAHGLTMADLICGINVLAHQPDINDFVEGLRIALKPDGIITMEFPHLMRLISECQFDTIYHEHYSYFSLKTICEIFFRHGLEIFDVEEIPRHGGSLRIYAQHQRGKWSKSWRVADLLNRERAIGMTDINYYSGLQYRVNTIKNDLMEFLLSRCCSEVAAYGAAAKGNTLLNYCGIKPDLIPYAVDRSPHKQGKYLPGSHIPVYEEEYLRQTQPEYVLILPWNLREEIMDQLKYIREWGGEFVIAVPKLEVL